MRTSGTIDRTLAIVSDLIRGAAYDRHAIAQTFRCSLAVADRYIRAIEAVPGVTVTMDGRRRLLRWNVAHAARAASPELGELVRSAIEEPRLSPPTGVIAKPATEYFYGYEVRADVAIRMERNIRIGLIYALHADGWTMKAIGAELKISRSRVSELLRRVERQIEKAADRRFPLPEEEIDWPAKDPQDWADHYARELAYREQQRLDAQRKAQEEREAWGRVRAMVFLLRSNGATIEETADLVGLPEATAFYFDQLLAQGIEEAWRAFQLGEGPWTVGNVWSAAAWQQQGPRGHQLTCAIEERSGPRAA